MTMQRRHYELIAEAIHACIDGREFTGPQLSLQQQGEVALIFARRLRSTNPNFNKARFLKACGVEG